MIIFRRMYSIVCFGEGIKTTAHNCFQWSCSTLRKKCSELQNLGTVAKRILGFLNGRRPQGGGGGGVWVCAVKKLKKSDTAFMIPRAGIRSIRGEEKFPTKNWLCPVWEESRAAFFFSELGFVWIFSKNFSSIQIYPSSLWTRENWLRCRCSWTVSHVQSAREADQTRVRTSKICCLVQWDYFLCMSWQISE